MCTVLYGKVSTVQYVHRSASIQERKRSLHFCFKHFPSFHPPLPLHFAERKPVPIHPPYDIMPDTPNLPQSIWYFRAHIQRMKTHTGIYLFITRLPYRTIHTHKPIACKGASQEKTSSHSPDQISIKFRNQVGLVIEPVATQGLFINWGNTVLSFSFSFRLKADPTRS